MISRRGAYRRDTGTTRSDEGSANKVDPETLVFIQKYLTSYTKWEMLKYFAENPDAAETARGFARRLNKDVRQISEALESLARTGIITNGNSRNPDEGAYTLTADETLRSSLLRIGEMARTNNRFRLLVNYHITKASLAKYKSNSF
ncbi:MAG: hypothetical protein ACM3US_04895 [Sphingomonadaceae bacterium]